MVYNFHFPVFTLRRCFAFQKQILCFNQLKKRARIAFYKNTWTENTYGCLDDLCRPQCSSSVFGPSACNTLPLSLRETPTLTTFKSNLKTSFLTSVGLSSLLFCFVCPRPWVDCWHVVVSVLSECLGIIASERALICISQDGMACVTVTYVCECVSMKS